MQQPHVCIFAGEMELPWDRPHKKRPRIVGTRSINLANSKRRFMDSLYDWYRNYPHFEFIRAHARGSFNLVGRRPSTNYYDVQCRVINQRLKCPGDRCGKKNLTFARDGMKVGLTYRCLIDVRMIITGLYTTAGSMLKCIGHILMT